jgi:hypothetical protein
MMAELKTKATGESVKRFLNGIEDEERRRDGFALVEIMKRATDADPTMWGGTIVGFGSYHYKYASGHEGDTCIAGFSPRKQNWTVYLMPGFDWASPLLGRLGKHSVGKGCLYFKRLADVDLPTLEKLITESVVRIRATYPASGGAAGASGARPTRGARARGAVGRATKGARGKGSARGASSRPKKANPKKRAR